jgi:uncharacterized integral membrane protein
MILSLILGLIIGALSVIFALQNIFPVTVTFVAWEFTTSLALIIILAILIGLMIAVILSIPETIKNMFIISSLKKENRKLTDEIESIQKTSQQALEINKAELPLV